MKEARNTRDAENDDVIAEIDLDDRRRLHDTLKRMSDGEIVSHRDFVAIDTHGSVAGDKRLSEWWHASSDALGSCS